MSKRRYTPAEICEIFAVSKSTLFRWEQEAVIPSVPRDEKNQRLYTSEHVRAISRRQGDVLRRRYDSALHSEDLDALVDISEANALRKFLDGDNTGLKTMEYLPRLSDCTIRHLLRVAAEEPDRTGPLYCNIIQVLSLDAKRGRRRESSETSLNTPFQAPAEIRA
jgi:hypothetical protein